MSRIGYWISDKKIKKLNFNEFMEISRAAGLELVKIDIDLSLEQQGPFDLILHKINDILAKANQGNAHAKARIKNFQDYFAQHPETVVIDPLENTNTLLDRHQQYRFIRECSSNTDCEFFIPPFVEFTSTDVEENKSLMEANNVQYPFVCKPTLSQGSAISHKMCLVFNEEGLRDVQPPCVAQTFINHNGSLHKIFTVGENFSVVQRPSIKNLSADSTKTIFFDSHDVSKADSCSFLNQVGNKDLELPVRTPDMDKLRQLAYAFHVNLGMSLVGIDVIIENHTGRYAVIDINTFPGYDGVPDLYPNLLDLILKKLKIERPNPTQANKQTTTSSTSTVANNNNITTTTTTPGVPKQQQLLRGKTPGETLELRSSKEERLLLLNEKAKEGRLPLNARSLSKEERVLNELNRQSTEEMPAVLVGEVGGGGITVGDTPVIQHSQVTDQGTQVIENHSHKGQM